MAGGYKANSKLCLEEVMAWCGSRERDFKGFETEPEPDPEPQVVDEIVFLGKSMGLEVDEGDVNELVEEHAEELTTEELKELQTMQHTEVLQEISSGEEEVEPEEVISSGEIKEMLVMWEKLSLKRNIRKKF